MGLTVAVQLGVLGALVALAGCAVQTSSDREGVGGSAGGATSTSPCASCDDNSAAPRGRVSPGSSTPSPTAMLGHVDSNVAMNASPGQGVGVFSEYDAGGHWHLWWTCDTQVTNESCAFDIKVAATTGTIINAAAEQFASTDTLITPSTPASGDAGAIEAKTLTTTSTSGVFFDSSPGATITVTATVGGLYNGGFLFWVQGGRVDDGYDGAVTDPLMLVGSSP